MFVRTASERDLPEASRLIGESLHAAYDALYGVDMVGSIAKALYSREALKAAMSRPLSEFLVADDGEAIAGVAFAAAPDDNDRVVDVLGLYVRPALQGHGIGGMLLQELEDSFFETERIRLEVDARNLRALGFLEGEGYERRGQRREEGLQATLVTLDKSLV